MSRRAYSLAFAGGLALAIPSIAFAQETDVGELVVTAAPFPISLDTATTHVEIIKSDELAVMPPGGLGDMLANVPGLRSSAYGPGASRPIIRGQSGQRVQVLQNGVGMIDASSLSPDHAVATDPMEAERIEVLRGPSALAYGGSGVGGVVNVIDDRIPRGAPQDGLDGRASASIGGPGDGRNIGGTIIFGDGPWVVSLAGDRRESDDYDVPVPPVSDRLATRGGIVVDPENVVLNTSVSFSGIGGGMAYIGDSRSLGVAYKHNETSYGVPFAQVLSPIDPDAEGPIGIDLTQDRVDLRGQTKMNLGPFALVRLTSGWADYRHAEIEQASGDIGTVFLSNGLEGRLEFVQAERDGWKGAVGLQGLSRDLQAIGDEAFIPASAIKESAIFTIQRFEYERWGFDAGLRIDQRAITAELTGRPASPAADAAGIDWTLADRDQAFTNVSASAGVFWRPSERAFYAVSASRNARSPTEFELFADGPHPGTGAFELGDPAIKAEVANSIELLGRWRLDRLTFEAHLFAARYDGFIDQRPTGDIEDGLPVFQFVQTDAGFTGGEAELSYVLTQNPDSLLKIEAAADWVRGSTDLGVPARIPPYGLTARLLWSNAHFDTSAEVRRVGEQDRVATGELPTDGYTTLNLFSAWRPRGDDSLRLYVDGRNLTDEEAREHVSFLKDIAPLPGRSVRVGLTTRF